MYQPRRPSDLPRRQPSLRVLTERAPSENVLWDLVIVVECEPPVRVDGQRCAGFEVSLVQPEIIVQPVMWRLLIQRFSRSARAGASLSGVTYLAIAPGTPSLSRARTHQPTWFAEQGHRRMVDPPLPRLRGEKVLWILSTGREFCVTVELGAVADCSRAPTTRRRSLCAFV